MGHLSKKEQLKYDVVKKISKLFFDITSNVEINGLDNIPRNGPVIIASNHESMFETVVLPTYFPRNDFHAVAKEEIWVEKDNSFGKKFQYFLTSTGGAYSINRDEPKISQIRQIKKGLSNFGESILIFPEGTRVEKVQKFHDLVSVLVYGTNIPVVPLAIYNSLKAEEYFSIDKLFNPKESCPKVYMTFGEPLIMEKRDVLRNVVITDFTNVLENKVRELYQTLETNSNK